MGFGYDVHRLEEGYTLTMGGIKIPHTKGVVGHSDADVLIHAICDALLGAAGLRDIGFHFPDTATQYKGIDSKLLLKDVVALLQKNGYSINNVDTTLCLQKPKISGYVAEMQKTLAPILGVAEEDISIKATTTEKLGFVGSEEGVSAYATALIIKNTSSL
ncbi:MAG: 2-C-methyl-D-erythritol 2,4-cyclodiphosphate synthase [Bacteroidetes bacterium ADurb.Bin408]|nr:MAG: 2-C-methyl-D-erythritol 2,4-cyclodiphosphate synthase [Bacteroidetes bacterium ADurb.Bin408]